MFLHMAFGAHPCPGTGCSESVCTQRKQKSAGMEKVGPPAFGQAGLTDTEKAAVMFMGHSGSPGAPVPTLSVP